jgi:hypothetical protein
VVLDKTDQDYSWVVLCQDARGKYRATDFAASLPTREAARQALSMAMDRAMARTDAELRAAQDRNPAGITNTQFERALDVLAQREAALRRRRWR